MDTLRTTTFLLIPVHRLLLNANQNNYGNVYLDDVDTLDDVETDDDVDTELEVDTLRTITSLLISKNVN